MIFQHLNILPTYDFFQHKVSSIAHNSSQGIVPLLVLKLPRTFFQHMNFLSPPTYEKKISSSNMGVTMFYSCLFHHLHLFQCYFHKVFSPNFLLRELDTGSKIDQNFNFRLKIANLPKDKKNAIFRCK